MAYGANSEANMRRAALDVDRILRGANPAELPVDQPTAYDLVVNATAARALGLTIPAIVATQVTEWLE
jgi:putative ABC transport system substrate-binding protein